MDEFPRRQYSYRSGPQTKSAGGPGLANLQPGGIYRFLMGRDASPVPLRLDQLREELGDPFAQLILGREMFPLTLRELIAALNEAGGAQSGVSQQRSFIVADGGQIVWSRETADLARQFRLVIVRGAANLDPSLFISTSKEIDSGTTFLQVVAWDSKNETLQFYDRRAGSWIWAGSSADALAPDTRGFGPFDSHVNGVLNMKELKSPWANWHSQAATIQPTALAPDDPFVSEDIWVNRSQAEDLELTIRASILRSIKARFDRCTVDGRLIRLPEFMRQVLDTTTVNLTSSSVSNGKLQAGGSVDLPLTFFVNSDVLVEILGLSLGITSNPAGTAVAIAAESTLYCAAARARFEFFSSACLGIVLGAIKIGDKSARQLLDGAWRCGRGTNRICFVATGF